MTRTAVYARFSSDLQSDKSIDDQIALCREVAAREGMTIVATFDDRAISGSSTVNRPGFQAMMRAAEARLFDVLLIEDVDRLARDQGDYHTARKRLDFLGIAIHTASGKVTRIDGALRALMGELYIENLVTHVRRGMDGVIRDGRHAGGRAFGYRPVPGRPGELEIVPAEADVVRWIFAEFVKGRSPRDLAGDLNTQGVKPARGARWNASTINGNMTRGAGILLNELYAGRIVWNKVRMIKDPSTGKRLSRPNDPSQFRRADAPHLRIVEEDTWQAAQRLKDSRRHAESPRRVKVPTMLSGLMRCGYCGGGMVSIGERKGTARIQCATYIESGSCKNGRRVKRSDVEALTLDALRRELMAPAVIAEYVKVYNAERSRLKKTAASQRDQLERRNGEIGRELQRAIDAIVKAGVDAATLAPQIKALEAERADIERRLAIADDGVNVVALHPAAIERYRIDVERLERLAPMVADGLLMDCSIRSAA